MNSSDSQFDNDSNASAQRVTLRDVAEALGVSLASVSLAMRDNTRISDAMRTRVREKAAEMGYAPDPRMEALARYSRVGPDDRKPVILAWLNLRYNPRELHKYKEFELYWKGASQAAARLGFHLEEVVAQGLSVDELVGKLKERDIRGILLAPYSPQSVIDLTRFPVDDFVVVRFGLETEKPILYSVTSDQKANGEMVFEQVRKRGYERIGFVAEQDLKLPFGAGFFWVQKELPRSKRIPMLLFPVASSIRTRRKILAEWIERENPDAIVTNQLHFFDMMAGLGYRIPEDIAVATTSIHDTPIDAGLDQNPEEIGRLGLLKLVSLMNEAGMATDEIQNQTLVKGSWVDGSMMPFKGTAEPVRAKRGKPTENSISRPVQQHNVAGKRITMSDIAKAVGVSQTSVSLAMNGNPRVSAKVRDRILKTAEKMGYRPDPMLSAMHRYSRTIKERTVNAELAWLNLWTEPGKLYAYREFQRYWDGAVDSALRHGFHLEEFIVKDMPLQRLDRILKTRNIRGILVPPCSVPAVSDLATFPWRDYVTVRLGVSCPVELPYSVATDDVGNAAMALETMVKYGYKRIAFVGDRAIQRTFGAGFYWAQRMQSVQIPEFYLPLQNPVRHRNKLAAWIKKERPDAIITDNGELPLLLEELGIRIPDDIALATDTMHDTPIDTGIDHNATEVGRMGIISLVSHLNDPTHDVPDIPSRLCVMGKWVDGSMMASKV